MGEGLAGETAIRAMYPYSPAAVKEKTSLTELNLSAAEVNKSRG